MPWRWLARPALSGGTGEPRLEFVWKFTLLRSPPGSVAGGPHQSGCAGGFRVGRASGRFSVSDEAIKQIDDTLDVAVVVLQPLFYGRIGRLARVALGPCVHRTALSVDGVNFRSSDPEMNPIRQGQLVDQVFFRSGHWFVVRDEVISEALPLGLVFAARDGVFEVMACLVAFCETALSRRRYAGRP